MKDASPDVVSALEQLEQATSPIELGRAYKTILDWRGRKHPWMFGRAFYEIAAVAVTISAFLLIVSIFTIEVSEFWRGALFGALAVRMIYAVLEWSSRRSPVTMSFLDRVDMAIDRWRHAVPAMRDFPK